MINQHSIIPPRELLDKWNNLSLSTQEIFVIVAQWGADQELEACCAWFADARNHGFGNGLAELFSAKIRTSRRPKPPSLKEQALAALERYEAEEWCEEMTFDSSIIRRALEALPE